MEKEGNKVHRVVVSGVGLVTPLGDNRETSWKNILRNETAVQNAEAYLPRKKTEYHRALQWAVESSQEALTDAQLGRRGDLGERFGCVVSSSKPLLSSFDKNLKWEEPGTVPLRVAHTFGIQGPVINLSSACATGLQSAMVGAEWIREGRCDFVLAGSSESSLHPLYRAGFSQMGVLSKKGKVCPFDKERDGFLMGEGAAVFLLERLESAQAREAKIYGELLGWDFSCDAHHAVHFNSNGWRMGNSFLKALKKAGVSQSSIGYTNAHGTGTVLNDQLETHALLNVFKEHKKPRVSSTKAATGHLLGATGAVELGFTLLALRDQKLPPTLNMKNPETEAIDFIPNRSVSCDFNLAASLSFGFGGVLAAMVVGKSGLP